jgi:hypothetical protein
MATWPATFALAVVQEHRTTVDEILPFRESYVYVYTAAGILWQPDARQVSSGNMGIVAGTRPERTHYVAQVHELDSFGMNTPTGKRARAHLLSLACSYMQSCFRLAGRYPRRLS